MTESEKLDRLLGKPDDFTKCFCCEHNLGNRCGMNQFDLFNKMRPSDDCPGFELNHGDALIEDEETNPHTDKECPHCGNDARWNEFEHKYVCTNDDCGYTFN